jgi:hypothetical protein
MQVDNMTEYRAWNTQWNGVKRAEEGDVVGYFGVTNLLGPRHPTQGGGEYFQWSDKFTMVQLKYSFIKRYTQEPYVIDKTFFTFYDVRRPLTSLTPMARPSAPSRDVRRTP